MEKLDREPVLFDPDKRAHIPTYIPEESLEVSVARKIRQQKIRESDNSLGYIFLIFVGAVAGLYGFTQYNMNQKTNQTLTVTPSPSCLINGESSRTYSTKLPDGDLVSFPPGETVFLETCPPNTSSQ